MTTIVKTERRCGRARGLGLAMAAGCLMLWSGLAQASPVPDSFSTLAKAVSPAVVNIASAQEVATSNQPNPFPFSAPPGSPFDQFFKQFEQPYGPGSNGGHEMATALGSGFIIDAEGYIVTNNHVIDGATEITVRLDDNSSYPATVVGTDEQTDLALLKIQAERALPVVPFGDSDKADVGDWVLAVGNPFGLGGTVTAGIISARGRNIEAGPYDDFLQVDASINRGNSGGPLFNMKGEVVGVNTAIFSPNGGSVGIGFAIPSNMVKTVVSELRDAGKVDRGWLGVMLQPVTPEIASAMGLDQPEGALVVDVLDGSPAAKASLRQGDVILDFGGEAVTDPHQLARIVADHPAGSKVKLTIWRDHSEENLSVVTGEKPMQKAEMEQPGSYNRDGSYHSDSLDADLAALTPKWRETLGLGSDVAGVVVVDVRPGSPFKQGLEAGDVIQKVGQADVSEPAEVETAIEQAKSASQNAVLLLISRQGQELFLGIELSKA